MAEAASLLYEQIADLVSGQIASGVLQPGDRAPSVRTLSRSAGVSIATVTQAYLLLEQRGVVEARPRSGYFVRSPLAPGPVPPRAVTIRSRRPRNISARVLGTIMESLGRRDVLALGSAVTAHAGTLNARLNRLTREVLRDHPELPNRLEVPPGDLELRRQIARRMALVGAATTPEQVVVTAGAMEAIALALRVACRAGDTVLVESPTYFGVLQVLQMLDLKVLEVANDPATGIDVGAVEQLAASNRIAAAVLMPNFNNPTGALTSDAAKARLVAALAGRGTVIIEDDIYGDLQHSGPRPKPLRAFDDSGLVITCGSVSKTIALGYRIGWAVTTSFAEDLSRAKFFSTVACPNLQQQVLARYYASGSYDRYLRQAREFLAGNRRRFAGAVLETFPVGTRVSNPQGGVVLWVQLPPQVDGVALFQHALAQRIGIAPGVIFCAGGGYRNFIRLSAGVAWSPQVEEALEVLGRLAGSLAGRRGRGSAKAAG
ncbi:MAG: PLP-dependent aminotransferase family protein [Pseudomonadales bacterium]